MAASMHTALQVVVKYFTSKKDSRCVNDVKLSQVQYKFIFGALVACAILSGLTNWFSRIDCAVTDSNLLIKRYIEEWCYSNSTFLIVDADDGFVTGNQFSSSSEKLFHVSYYQWVTLTLLVQAACFQIPRLLWKCVEGGCISRIVSIVVDPKLPANEARKQAIAHARDYIKELKAFKHYFNNFALCQCLYFINALAQIYFVQAFLGNEFLSLLPSFIQGSPTWNKVFPRRVKCNFFIDGPTGATQALDVLCVLSMNVLFEKIYLFVWILLAVSLLVAIAQNVLVFKYAMAWSTAGADGEELNAPSKRLMLKFLALSLDPELDKKLMDEKKHSPRRNPRSQNP